jgi:4-hydroxybenzoyl-CoA reductase subunit beta
MKRRQQTPAVVVGLRGIEALREARWNHAAPTGRTNGGRTGKQGARAARGGGNGGGPGGAGSATVILGAGLTLTQLVRDDRLAASAPALWEAAAQIATPHLRSMGTLGGNICLDTRCNYYDQNYEWRKAIGFCMKRDGETCWVATSSPRCLAVSSTDTAPALLALDAHVRLMSQAGEREVALADLYRNDGIHYMERRPDEILTEIRLDFAPGWRSTYWKLRRRGAFDFPVLSVAAAARFEGTGRSARVAEARIVLGAVASQPLVASDAAAVLAGHALTDDVIAEAATKASALAKPMDNTDFVLGWRKRVTQEFVSYALRHLRGDDLRAVRRRYTHHDLIAAGAVG